jgi:glycine betaine/proline transport system ATP-binding protein
VADCAPAVVEFDRVDVVFGPDGLRDRALTLLDAGEDREEILRETGAVIGVAGAELTVLEGQICVLMGLSGSGKSSLLRCVNGLNRITRGRLLVHGGAEATDVATCDPAALRELRMNRISMVFQQFGLLPWRTVRDNVGFGLELKGVAKDEIRRRVDEKLGLVHLESWADNHVSELSGGMQQRVGLARAFATDGDILLMDEPFSALDPLIRQHLQDELLELQRRLHKTIVFVSHDLDEALKIGSRIVIMDGGRIVQQGRPHDIVFDPVNEYVRAFVSNINPLQVLTAGALMRPFGPGVAGVHAGDELTIRIGETGSVEGVQAAGRELSLVPLDALLSDAHQPTDGIACTASPQSPLRELLAGRRRTGHPVLVVDDGQVVGIIGEAEIYDGLLREG